MKKIFLALLLLASFAGFSQTNDEVLITVKSGAAQLTPTPVKTSAYSAAANDFVPVDATSANVTVTLPNAPSDKTQIGVKLIAVAGGHTATIALQGSDVLNKTGGSTSFSLYILNQGVILQYASATHIWYVRSTDIPLSGLDARFAAIGSGSGSSAWGGITGTLGNQADLQAALNLKVDNVTGKQLSTEDYTTAEKAKLAGLSKDSIVFDIDQFDLTGSTISIKAGLLGSGGGSTYADSILRGTYLTMPHNIVFDTVRNRVVTKEKGWYRFLSVQDSIAVASSGGGGGDTSEVALTALAKSSGTNESPAGTWCCGGDIVFAQTMAGDGYFVVDIPDITTTSSIVIALDTDPTLDTYTNIAYGVFNHDGSNYAPVTNGAPGSTGITPVAGDRLRLRRASGIITAEYYRSGVWTLIYTFPTSTTATLYLKSTDANSGHAVYNPKGRGVL